MSEAALRVSNAPLRRTLKRNWPLYFFEAAELAIFMLSACAFTVFLFDPSYSALPLFPSAVVRRIFMGIAMGITAILIIHSPMGKRSGAHFNPAITITYFRLRKISRWDAMFYVLFQFVGGVLGVAVAAIWFGGALAQPTVEYAVTIPGKYGVTAAFFAELFMAGLLMAVVLWMTNRPSLATYTGYTVGVLIAFYVLIFAPVSGFSINPARTTGSAVFAGIWTAGWLYFAAPLLGMLAAAEVYLRLFGADGILCAKLHPDRRYPCPFLCNFPGHRPTAEHPLEA